MYRGLTSTRGFGRVRWMTSKARRQSFLPGAYYRGGTSRAVFFNRDDLPADRSKWDPILRGVIGSPDEYGRQLDGLGGGISSLSKVCIVGESTHPEAEVDYTFVSLGIKNGDVDYSSNCGNMVSAVGPYAVDSKLVNVVDSDSALVRIHNTNTGKLIHATFPVIDGEASANGDLSIDGVSGTGSRICLDFIDPAGSVTGKLLPTGNVTDEFEGVTVTCIDAANPCVFVKASSLGVQSNLTPDEITAHPNLLSQLDLIRRQAAVEMGIAKNTDSVPGSIPKICMVSSPKSDDSRSVEQKQTPSNVDLVVRALSVGQAHKAIPITVALALAAARRVAGSTVDSVASKSPVDPTGLTIGHASGNLMVGANFDTNGELQSTTVFRTARRLFEGRIFWKDR